MKTFGLLASLLPITVFGAGFQTCSVPAAQIASRGGVERPVNRADDAVCIAVLPPVCANWVKEHKPCAVRACLVAETLRTCPDGAPAMFTSQEIQPFVPKSVKPMTQEEFAAMNRKIDEEAKRLAAKWTDNGRTPLSPEALTVLHNISCQVAAAANPDVRCVSR